MSLLKFIKAQLGISNTPANNFTLDASAQDGTMKLSRGNAGATTQDVMVVDAAGKVTFPAGSQMLGVGQTWQTVTASRALGTHYTNNTGRTIEVAVFVFNTSPTLEVDLKVDGVRVDYVKMGAANSDLASLRAIVPAGATYIATARAGSPALFDWVELR